MNLNVFHNFPYTKRYYLFHPFTFLLDLFECFKKAKSRITKGYCGTDVWDMDMWFCTIIPNMLRKLTKDGVRYPEKYESIEKWHDYLNSIADLLEASNLDIDDQNEYWEEFCNTHPTDANFEDIEQKYLDRQQQLFKEQQIMSISAMKQFSELISSKSLWD